MSQTTVSVPRCPPLLAVPLRVVPLAPLSASLTAFSRRIATSHPGLFRRLGDYANTPFVIDPTDLPLVILLQPGNGTPKVTVTRRPVEAAARIAGPLAALLGLVHGGFDGDALFFSRDLVIEGDTSASLALRNAIDDAELDLSEELLNLTGPLAAPVHRALLLLERRTGLYLTRPEEPAW